MKPLLPFRIFNKAPVALPVEDQNWYRIKAETLAEQTTIEIYIYGEIGGWGITANQFIQDLKAIDDGVSPIVAAFNTIGGDLFDGLAIHNALNRLGERCTARIDALAASAGSVAACGAHRMVMASNAMLMIHNPWTFTAGDAEDLRKVADVLDQTLEAIIAAYKAKSPDIDEAELRRMVNAETWLTAQEALALGLADEIGSGVEVKACLGQGAAMQRYRQTPKALLDQLNAVEPEPDQDDPPTDPEPADASALALMITKACGAAGINNLIEPLIASTKLADHATVQAAITQAKCVRDLCVAARLPELTAEFVTAGLGKEAVQARLFDKLVSSGKGFEIDNSLPLQDDPPAKVQARQPDHQDIYAARRAAHNGKKQTSTGAR
ncbi:head maturation protease, ClpP-related [Pseudomonas viridiflava]|uniref:head maturation protease, ClpP-related n=1 Tax=Pseudomonas syringae group TaxID=136849 RepID=UPI00211D9F19|nr:head maturation protease, ClpP-related [Pseudomonas viridiflava]MCF9017349.1 Clp protease ClpP [Pseudomonas syringae]MCQ9393312.1 Clp protease ClpP [Pseudomonas viridiflava]MEE4091999.1 head maturation protease, ClpP-related [Pseudomonas viridiflava]